MIGLLLFGFGLAFIATGLWLDWRDRDIDKGEPSEWQQNEWLRSKETLLRTWR